MSRVLTVLCTFLFLLVMVEFDDNAQKPLPVEIQTEHWEIDDHYAHTITFKADGLKALGRSLQEYHPYYYENKIEIRFVTDSLHEFEPKFNEIKTTLRNDFPNW